MALTIDGATVGYSEEHMNNTLAHVHNNCVIATKKALRNNLNQLRDNVHACWQGQSAETFLANMETDVGKICDGLDSAYNGLVAEFKKVLAGLAEIDQSIVERR